MRWARAIIMGRSMWEAGLLPRISGCPLPTSTLMPIGFRGANTDPWGNVRAGFSASTVINRHDYGLNWNKALETGGFVVGDDVTITLEIQGVLKKT
jgi:hypothetical protein